MYTVIKPRPPKLLPLIPLPAGLSANPGAKASSPDSAVAWEVTQSPRSIERLDEDVTLY